MFSLFDLFLNHINAINNDCFIDFLSIHNYVSTEDSIYITKVYFNIKWLIHLVTSIYGMLQYNIFIT